MALVVRPQPFAREVDRLFDAFFGGEGESRRWVPPMDLWEAGDHYVLKADLPGVAEDDVSIEVQDGTLTIAGQRGAEERGETRVVPLRALVRLVHPLAVPAGRNRPRRDRGRVRPRRARGPDPEAGGAQAPQGRDQGGPATAAGRRWRARPRKADPGGALAWRG